MDPVKTGKFLARLRRGAGLTQEVLGETLGVSNKTISRWENGKTMPDLDMLQRLGDTFHVSLRELLAGERLAGEDLPVTVDAAARETAPSGSFTRAEREVYWKEKWRRDHRALLLLLAALVLLTILLPLLLERPWFSGLTPLAAFAAYGYQHNRMMAYVEHQLYD